MADVNVLEVRVSRKLLLVLTAVGLLFLLAGLEIGYFQKIVGPGFTGDKVVVKWLFLFFSVICGGAIFINCLIYFFVPPLLLKVTPEKITFGTGLRYNPFEISARFVEKAESFTKQSDLEVDGKRATVDGGAFLYLKNDPSIPSQLTTSMGIKYSNFKLEVESRYADLSGPEIVQKTKEILGLKN